jgi:DNA-binding response OmpR family regulator
VRVLIVEDERRLATLLARGLTAEGFAVDVAYDGADGLLRARTTGYDIVVLDVNLPRLNGYRLVAQLRSEAIDVPVLMLTAKDGAYDEAEGLDAGADDYLTKPFSYMVLLARIRALLRRGNRGVSNVTRLGDLRIDSGSHRVHRGSEEIELTTKEFAVLGQLVVRPGDVVSKSTILEHVWDHAYEGHPNIVEVYISALRRKLGADLIQTVRGAGYRMVNDA